MLIHPFQKALHVRALRAFKDQIGVERKSGEEWLVTVKDTASYIPDVQEEVREKHETFFF